MIHRVRKYQLLCASSLFVITFYWHVPHALAHTNHDHNRQKIETISPEESDTPASSSPSTTETLQPSDVQNTDIQTNDIQTNDIQTNDNRVEPLAEDPIQVPEATSPVSPPVSSTSPDVSGRVVDGFSMGLGESLLGLMVTGPFMLIFLKKRCRS